MLGCPPGRAPGTLAAVDGGMRTLLAVGLSCLGFFVACGGPLGDDTTSSRSALRVPAERHGDSEDAGSGIDAGLRADGGSTDAGCPDAGADGGCLRFSEVKEINGRRADCTTVICATDSTETRGPCTETRSSSRNSFVCVDQQSGQEVENVQFVATGLSCSRGCKKPYKDRRLPGGEAELDTVQTYSGTRGARSFSTTGVSVSIWRDTGWSGTALSDPAPGNDLSTCF